MGHDELIESIGRRVRDYRGGGDAGRVTEAAALEEAISLGSLVMRTYDASGVLDPEGFLAVVELFLARSATASDDERRDSELSMLRSMVRHVAPGVPPDLLELLGVTVLSPAEIDARFEHGLELLTRADAGDNTAIGSAIAALVEVLEQLGPNSRRLPAVMSNLGAAIRLRYQVTGSQEDLMRALEANRTAVDLGKRFKGISGHGIHQFNYGVTAWLVYETTGDPVYAELAVDAYLAAREALPPDHPNSLWVRRQLVWVISDRLKTFRDARLIDKFLDVAPELVGRPDDDTYPDRLSNVGMACENTYAVTGMTKFIEAAQTYLEEAVKYLGQGHEMRPAMLTNLNLVLRARSESTGDLQLLERAIGAGREAVAAGRAGHPDLEMYTNGLNALSSALRVRFEMTGDLESLDQAIELAGNAARLMPAGPNRAAYLTVLGNALKVRFERVAEQGDLDRAVETHRAALVELQSDSQDRALLAGNLAGALLQVDTPTARDEAIDLLRETMIGAPVDHPHIRICASNLCGGLAERYEESGNLDDLTEAIANGRSVLASLAGQAQDAELLNNLGRALIAAARRESASAYSAEAIALLQNGARLATARPDVRQSCAHQWAFHAASTGRWSDALDAYSLAIDLFVRRAARHLTRTDVEHHLRSDAGLVWDAVGCAVRAGAPGHALRLLEQGRGILLNHVLDLRGDVSELAAQAPNLAVKFQALCAAFERLPSAVVSDVDSDRRVALAHDWDNTLAEIRDQPGLENFLRSPDEADLRAAAVAGPVVIVNTSRYGVDAIIVKPDRITAIQLPNLDPSTVPQRVTRFLAAASHLTGVPGDPARSTVLETFNWLWEVIAAPVLDELKFTASSPSGAGPRVWWSPTGMLTLLPLHMAGNHDGSTDTLLDRVISSYAPTLRVLRRAQSRPVPPGPSDAGAVVALPRTPGRSDLPGAESEVQLLAAHYPDATMLTGSEATSTRVLDVLSHAPWAHFACHAGSDPMDPAAASIHVHDGSIGVAEISRLRLAHAELAYLGACETARGGATLADETIHIASAFQLAGYRHVVAAQWPLADDIALDAAKAVYSRINLRDAPANLASLAAIVHTAIRELRERYPDRPEHWGALIHIGP